MITASILIAIKKKSQKLSEEENQVRASLVLRYISQDNATVNIIKKVTRPLQPHGWL